MLGSVLMRWPNAYGTTRRYSNNPYLLTGIDVTRFDDLRRAIDWSAPEVVINCAGIVKSECEKHERARVDAVNGDAPHVIAKLAGASGCRVVHISTDCVFDGTHGGRTEQDTPDAFDSYGRSKRDGELIDYGHCVTLRTSFIGRDPIRKRGLLEWLLAQKHDALGFTQMFWSGLSTHELARAIECVIAHTSLSGLYHVSGPVISKADLLQTLVEAYDLPIQIQRVDEPHINRTLNGRKFNDAADYSAPTWQEMAKGLAGGLLE